MQYDYERFTPDRFQEFCQALVVRDHPNLQCYPVGQKDGGRDARSTTSHGASIIFQVKFKRDRLKNDDTFAIIKKAIDLEISKIDKLVTRGATEYIIITNLGGTSALDVGSMDRAEEYLRSLVSVPSAIWWRPDIDARLNNAYDLKWVFSEIVTSADMFRMLIKEGLGENSSRRILAVTAYLTAQYTSDEYVKFKQADLQASDLLSLFIDVPVESQENFPFTLSGNHVSQVFRTVQQDELSENSKYDFRNKGIGGATILLHHTSQKLLRRIIVEGAPGQGKSTLAQYVCQVHRMRFLGKEDKLDQIPAKHRLSPFMFPFKVDLRDFSSWIGRINPITGIELDTHTTASLESFLAAQISHHSGGQAFTVDDLILLLSRSSALIFLDGLDEVATLPERKSVIEAINGSSARLESLSPNSQIIVTSRPAAVANMPRFNSETWDYFKLESITKDLIFDYTERWSSARNISPMDVEEIKRILQSKLSSSHIKDLARNAMQLTILLNLVHARGQALPDHRTDLYDSYIEVFFNREADKNKVVLQNRQLLINLHGYLAWKIHSAAESRKTSGRVTEETLRSMIFDYLTTREYDTDFVDDLLAGVVQRIVAIVSRVEGTFEFEVQPLREYFAARHLYNTAPYSPAGRPKKGTKPEIFAAIAPNPYWLNVTRFYSGCYSVGELPGLVDQIEELLSEGEGANTSFPRVVATSLLSDRVFNQAPKVSRRVAKLAIDALTLRYAFHRSAIGGNGIELSLPADCGVNEVTEILIDRAMNLVSPAARTESAILLSWTANEPKCAESWLAARPQTTDTSAVERWLELGRYARALTLLTESDAELFSNISINSARTLAHGGHPSIISSSESEMEFIIDFCDGNTTSDNPSGNLGIVGLALNALRYTMMTGDTLLGFGNRLDKPLSPKPKSATLNNMVSEIRALISDIKSDYARPHEWQSDRAIWDRTLQIYERSLGRTWLSWKLANTGCVHIADSQKFPIEEYDGSNSPLDLALAANRNRKNVEWWRIKFENTVDPLTQRALLLMFAHLGTPANLRKNMKLVDYHIELIGSDNFRSLIEELRREPGNTIPAASARDLIAVSHSQRTKSLIALRANVSIRANLGYEFDSSTFVKDPILADLTVEWVLDEKAYPDNEKGWISLLKTVSAAFKVSENPFGSIRFRFSTPTDRKIPHTIAREILVNPDSYPSELILLADQSVSIQQDRSRNSLSSIARKDRWSAN